MEVRPPEISVSALSFWPSWFSEHTGGKFPSSFVTYDCETSGFSRENDLVLEFGHVLVRDNKGIDRSNVVLNWFDDPVVPADWLRSQLDRVSQQMRIANKSWHLTEEVIRDTGLPPKEVLQWMYELFRYAQDKQLLCVGHNVINFDQQMILGHFEQDLGLDFEFDPDLTWDTSAIEKASQLVDTPASRPRAGECLRDYFKRINAYRVKGLYTNSEHCVRRYGLTEKYGVDVTKLHSAGEDAYVVYLLMQEFGKAHQRHLEAMKRRSRPVVTSPSPVAPSTRFHQRRD